MKKRLWGAVIFLTVSLSCSAQVSFTWNEFFKQKKTEIKYLGQQIAELQVYLGFVKEGYKLVSQGNKLIQQAKNGELNLHDVFYLSLKLVNRQIKNYPAVRKIIDHHTYIARTSADLLKRTNQHPLLSDDDKRYVEETLQKLRSDMTASLDELMTVLRDGDLELSDDERIRKIDALESYASKRVLFIKSYYAHVMGKAAAMQGEQAESAVLRSYHEIK
ncbi:hypothetical protein [Chitinophaga rhizosphaerae]|uniref:hypothetical protein n=1 Tax=Chitinophaga rhizosphaerae TaxID=1864947 RepID=UPI000F815A74|nr:hypothetical protein [Chitinophaga rhizosphaerae]